MKLKPQGMSLLDELAKAVEKSEWLETAPEGSVTAKMLADKSGITYRRAADILKSNKSLDRVSVRCSSTHAEFHYFKK